MPDRLCLPCARALAAAPAASDDNCLEMRGLLLTGGVPHALVVSDSAYLGAPLPAALVRSVALYAPPQASAAADSGFRDQATHPAAIPQLRAGAGHGPDSGAAASSGPAPALEAGQAAASTPAPALEAGQAAVAAQPQLRGASRAQAAGLKVTSGPAAQVAAAPGLAQQGAGVGSGAGAPALARAPSAGSFAPAGFGSGAHAGGPSAVAEALHPGQGGQRSELAPQPGPEQVGVHVDNGVGVSGGVARAPTSSPGSLGKLSVQTAALPAGSDFEGDASFAASGPAPAPAMGMQSAGQPERGLAAAPEQAPALPEAPPAADARPALHVGAYAAEYAASSAGAQNLTEPLNPGGMAPSRAAAGVRAGTAAGPTSVAAENGKIAGAGDQSGASASGAGAADGQAAALDVGSYPG